FVPNHHLKIKYALPGAIFASIGLVLLSQFFTLITQFMGGDAITNATLGGFIALMLFLYLANVVLLFGALINTLTFELRNNISVPEYELERHEKEERKESRWQGYPDENEVKVLKRKIYKVN
ncbi:MAG TPA: YhjD/YihY/BrkB family envelope integrity protein, partial [Atopostipes sp.]|nr:YhjD/YihY/BrkB family envelope integrity protein [Atopostipes sp.]